MKSLATTLMMLNFLSAPVALIWLAILGQWWPFGIAFLSLFSVFFISIALMPLLLLMVPLAKMFERNPRRAVLFAAPSLIYTAALMTAWCVLVLVVLLNRATSETWIPLLLLAYSIGVAPWGYMANKEAQGGGNDGVGAFVAVFFLQLGLALGLLYFAIAKPATLVPVVWILGVAMAGEVIFSLLVARSMTASEFG